MEWHAFLLWLNLVTAHYCKTHESKQSYMDCREMIRDCVLDGETIQFCKKNWK